MRRCAAPVIVYYRPTRALPARTLQAARTTGPRIHHRTLDRRSEDFIARGGTMKIIAFIKESRVIEKILRHCELWKEPAPHPPPVKILGPPKVECGPELDYQLLSQPFLKRKEPGAKPPNYCTAFDQNCV
jgi:hypothetical protein